MFNYYTRILSGHNNNPDCVNEKLEFVRLIHLQKVAACLTVEGGYSALEDILGWEIKAFHSNSSTLSFRQALSMTISGKWKLLSYRFLYPKKDPSEEFKSYFEKENIWDINLYSAAMDHRLNQKAN